MVKNPAMKDDLPIIGLTGGIGSGKSTVATILGRLGCVVADADVNAKTALQEEDVREQLVQWWGEQVIDDAGNVDRSAVASIVFRDQAERERLESLLHPKARAMQNEQFDRAPIDTIALVIDAPLLLEAGLDALCDAIIFVDAPKDACLQRVQKNRGWDAKEMELREVAQLPLDTKRHSADYVVINEGDLHEVKRQVEQVLTDIQHRKFDKN